MTLEGFDVAPLIETAGFSLATVEATEPDAATLDAALREIVRAERAAARADATVLDLWIDRPGGSNLRALERPALGAGTSWHAWALLAEDGGVLDLSGRGLKGSPLFAAVGDEEDDSPPIVVVGSSVDEGDDDGGWTGGGYGDGSYGDSPGGDVGDGGTGTDLGGSSAEKVAGHTEKCGTDDGAAVQVAKHVMGTAPDAGPPNPLLTSNGFDWTQVEFGAIISRNAADGRFGALNDAIYSNGMPGYAHLPSLAGSDAVGIWHNHPRRGNEGQQDIDRYPSSAAGRDDWDALQGLKDTVAPNDPNFDPSLWITGPDGTTREFKLSERAYYESLTSEQMQADEGLDGKGRTQSCS